MSAATRIDELKKRYEENPRRFFAPLANEYRKSGDLEQAIALCQQHLADQPGNMNGHVVYGQALYEGGRFEEARSTFETALSLDPENLIALRHLGDISRTFNDYGQAREWYARVLDADPRNEEIIGFIAEIDAAGPSDAGGVGGKPSVLAPDSPGDVTAQSASATAKPEPLGDAVTLQIEARRANAASTAPGQSQEFAARPMAGRPPVATPSEVGAAQVAMATGTEEVVVAPAPSGRKSLGLMDLSIDLGAMAESVPPVGSLETPLPASESTHVVETFAELNFEDASAVEDSSGTSSAPMEGVAHHDSTSAGGLEFQALDFDAPPSDPVPLAVSPDSASRSTPVFGVEAAPQPAEPAKAFVTETMAELYLQQGFHDEALAVYRQLAGENPDDARLRDLVDQVERGTLGDVAREHSSEMAEHAADEVTVDESSRRSLTWVPMVTGPDDVASPMSDAPVMDSGASWTARQFFSAFAMRTVDRADGTPPSEVTLVGVAAPPPQDPALPARRSDGALDSLFARSSIGDDDESVAVAFALVGESIAPDTAK